MAFIDFFYGGQAQDGAQFNGDSWIYNLHFAVGPGAPNQHEDVATVQTLLSAAAPTCGGMHAVQIDGRFGPDTQSQILAFQRYCKAKGAPIAVDGRIDRARGNYASVSHTRYTIRYLNDAAYQAHPDYFPKLDDAIPMGMPATLWRVRARGVTD